MAKLKRFSAKCGLYICEHPFNRSFLRLLSLSVPSSSPCHVAMSDSISALIAISFDLASTQHSWQFSILVGAESSAMQYAGLRSSPACLSCSSPEPGGCSSRQQKRARGSEEKNENSSSSCLSISSLGRMCL